MSSEYQVDLPGFMHVRFAVELAKNYEISTNEGKPHAITLQFMSNISEEFMYELQEQKHNRYCSHDSMLKVEEFCYTGKFDDTAHKLDFKILFDLFKLEKEFENVNFHSQLIIATYRSYLARGIKISELLALTKKYKLQDLEGKVYGDIFRYKNKLKC